MKILIISPVQTKPNIDEHQKICLIGISFGNVTFGLIVDFNWINILNLQ